MIKTLIEKLKTLRLLFSYKDKDEYVQYGRKGFRYGFIPS